MSVDLATVKRVARLARIAVTEEEAQRMTGHPDGDEEAHGCGDRWQQG
jgi:aspartyl-tRNA(Asn)/glutamyl-tRNA(Gln) amidotransferase subunit C